MQIEASESAESNPTPPEGCDEERFLYHLDILEEAGFVKIGVKTYDGYSDCRLTWSGPEHLNAVRDSGVWRKVKEKAAQFEGVPVSVIGEFAATLIQQRLLEP